MNQAHTFSFGKLNHFIILAFFNRQKSIGCFNIAIFTNILIWNNDSALIINRQLMFKSIGKALLCYR